MGQDAKELLRDALLLTPEERAALAVHLIDSLDEIQDPDADAAWAAEITRRAREIESGAARPIPWDELRSRIVPRAK